MSNKHYQKPITDAVALGRQLATEVASRAYQADKLGQFPAEDAAALRASGYSALNLPKTTGGYGFSLRDCIAAQLELAKGSTSTALVAGMNMQVLGHENELRNWPNDIYERISYAATSDGVLINSVASEPKLGSPSRGGSYATEATVTTDGAYWVINGHKNWITGGRHLTHMFIKLSLDGGNGVILVEQDTPGLRWDETWGDALSLRASDSHDLYLENARVPRANRADSQTAVSMPNVWFPLVMAATYLGGAMGARDAVISYALERVPTALGRPIATLPKIQRQIGEIDVSLMAARTLLLAVAAKWPGHGDEAVRRKLMPDIAAAKTLATDTANRVTEKTLQIAGGASISKDLPLERFFRDVRAGAMHPPSGDSALEMIGRAAIGPIPTNGHSSG